MSDMTRAAGLLIYRKSKGVIEYLLLQASYKPYHWTPPKGHVDPGEDEYQAAVRETQEEAGVKVDQLSVHKDFRYEMKYTVEFHGATKLPVPQNKSVIYWLARAMNDDLQVTLSDEHQSSTWAPLCEAIKLAKFPEMEKMLNSAEEYLKTNSP